MVMLPTKTTLVSIGQLACQCQASLERVVGAAQELGIVAAERRDGIPWLTGDDAERIRQHVVESK